MRIPSGRRGFTLVEVMIALAIIAVLAALAIYGVSRYLAAAKSAEAKEAVGEISKLASLVFERERAESELVASGGVSKPAVNALCESATVVPAAIPLGQKYQPNNNIGSDFHTGTPVQGWLCLGFTMASPIYYQYSYFKGGAYVSPGLGGPDPGSEGFEAAARGDLDGDGVTSTIARTGIIVGNSLKLSTQVFVHNEHE
jgi:type IV pilus assembly protein PilA